MHALRSSNSNVKTVSLVAITFNQILEMKKPMTLSDAVLVLSNIESHIEKPKYLVHKVLVLLNFESFNINKPFKVLLN